MRRILLTSPVRPYPLLDGRFSPFDQMTFRFTRGQGIFTLQEHTHFYGLHLMAQNVGCPCRVLEFPAMADFEHELAAGDYAVVGITANVFNLDTVLEMCSVARRVAPAAHLVVGGHGTRCLADGASTVLRVGQEVDALCTGDGVRFLRGLLGEKVERPVSCRLPLCGSALPWLDARLPGNSGTILSGLGCTTRCSFCATSAQHRGKYVEVLDARGIFEAMKRYWRSSASCNFVTLIDENLLNQRPKWQELGRLVRDDRELGLARLNYFIFASANHVASLEPEELLLSGVDSIFIGVESVAAPFEKLRGVDMKELFSRLHQHGIGTVGSTIVGLDHQTPQNISSDLDHYIGLSPTLQQIGILNVVPATPDWLRLRKEGRLVDEERFSERNIYGHTFSYLNFRHEELQKLVDDAYRLSFERNGPSVLRFLEVTLNGYDTCRRSPNPLLSREKAALFARRAEVYGPMAAVVAEHAPGERVREKALELERRWRELFHPQGRQHGLLREFLLRRAAAEARRLAAEGPRRREEPYRVYSYLGDGGPKPYRVQYAKSLGSDPFFRPAVVS